MEVINLKLHRCIGGNEQLLQKGEEQLWRGQLLSNGNLISHEVFANTKKDCETKLRDVKLHLAKLSQSARLFSKFEKVLVKYL